MVHDWSNPRLATEAPRRPGRIIYMNVSDYFLSLIHHEYRKFPEHLGGFGGGSGLPLSLSRAWHDDIGNRVPTTTAIA